MTEAQKLHKQDLEEGAKALATYVPQSDQWWSVKGKIGKYEIAFAQALNLAVSYLGTDDSYSHDSVDAEHLYFYQLLTEPYRVHPEKLRDGSKKSKPNTTLVNIDDEIQLPEGNADFGN